MRPLHALQILLPVLAAPVVALPAKGQPARQEVARQESSASRVEMAFNPPLDQMLRFRVTKTRTRNGKLIWPGSMTTVEEVRFVRAGDGYILFWRIDPAALPAIFEDPTARLFTAPMIAPFTGEPLAFELDSTGAPVHLRDWPAAKARILAAISDLIKNSRVALPSQGAALDRNEAEMRGMFERLDEQGAITTLLGNLLPAIGWGGFAIEPGTTHAGETTIPIPLLQTEVKADIMLTLVSIDPGHNVTLTEETRVDGAAMQGLIETLIQRFGVARTPEQDREIASLKNLSSTTTVQYVFDLPTGLPISFDVTRQLGDGSDTREMRRIEWLR